MLRILKLLALEIAPVFGAVWFDPAPDPLTTMCAAIAWKAGDFYCCENNGVGPRCCKNSLCASPG